MVMLVKGILLPFQDYRAKKDLVIYCLEFAGKLHGMNINDILLCSEDDW